jgi:hypothetical protein
MKYVKFETAETAEEYRVKLQAHHDATINQDKTKPRVIDCIFMSYDNKFVLSLEDETWPETDGEIVDSIESPVVEMPE